VDDPRTSLPVLSPYGRDTHLRDAAHALDLAVAKAVQIAKEYLTAALVEAVDLGIGHGHGPLNHFLGRQVENLSRAPLTRRRA